MLTIEQATAADIDDLAAHISSFDAAELAAAGHSVQDCLSGVQAQALRQNGQLVCLFGAVTHELVPGGAIPWMLCTETLASVPRRAMAAVSARVVAGWQLQFSHLSNLVHRRNARAIKFVQWLGFKVNKSPCGPGGEFFAFEWRRDV